MQQEAGSKNSDKQLKAIRRLIETIGDALEIDASGELWDGSTVPLGRSVTSPLRVTIAGPGVIASLPTCHHELNAR